MRLFLKNLILKYLGQFLFDTYKSQFKKLQEENLFIQKEKLEELIYRCHTEDIAIVVEMNPMTAYGMVAIYEGHFSEEEEEEPKKDNPFRLIKDDEDNTKH